MTIDYDASSLSGWCGLPFLIVRFRGTILAGTIFGPLFWLSNLAHIALLFVNGRFRIGHYRQVANASHPDAEDEWVPAWEGAELPVLDWKYATIGIALLFFFIVFYNNNSYSRFYTLYGHTVGMGARVMEWTALVKQHSLNATPEHRWAQWNCVRLMLAGMNILYYSLFGGDMDKEEWARIVERNLLSVDEVRQLKDYKGMKPFLAVVWALDEAQALVREKARADESLHHDLGQGMRDELIHQQFRDVAFQFRGHCGQIVNLLKQPVPFPYFHLLSMMLLIQLLMIAYALASPPSASPYFTIPVMVIISIVLVGMRSLAVQLSNPFGNDSVDFDIEKFMKGAYTNAVALLLAERDVCASAAPSQMRCPLLPDGGQGLPRPAPLPPPGDARQDL